MAKYEEPSYSVITSNSKKRIEIRQYGPRIVAETFVDGEREKAANEAFRILAGYIFGNNSINKRIAMTVPVTESQSGEKIAMTVPVSQTQSTPAAAGSGINGPSTWSMQFTMPSKYTLDTLPTPNDSRIEIKQVAAYQMAAITFSGMGKQNVLDLKELELRQYLKEKGFNSAGRAVYAFYNAPFTLPFLRRNEVLLEVKTTDG